MPLIVLMQGILYAYSWGLLQPIFLSRFGFSPLMGSIVLASAGVLTVGVLTLMHRHAERISERAGLSLVAVVVAAGLLLAAVPLGWRGFVVMFALELADRLLNPFMSELLNNHAAEEQRSTVLSIASFLRSLPYVVLAPLIGYLSTSGQLVWLLVAWPFLIVAGLARYLLHSRGRNGFGPQRP